jgi:hypothetical protein
MLQHIVPIVFSILFGGLIFYLLKKKITTIENKVNLMFQLIQEHEKKEQLRNNYQQTSNSKNSNDGLIDVSDEEDNSVEESDDEDTLNENENENITDNYDILNNVSSNENSKQIAMNLISQLDNTLNMVDGITDSNINKHNIETDEESSFDTDDTDNESDKLNIQGSIESLEQSKIISLDVENNDRREESISLTEIKNVSKSNDNTLEEEVLDSINLDSKNINNNDTIQTDDTNNDNDNDIENDNSDLDEVTLDDENIDNKDNNDKKSISELLKSYTVSELKKECSKRNLTNFKSLKKTALIELLENS